MRLRSFLPLILLAMFLVTVAGTARAADGGLDFDQLLADGWQVVAPGVMQKHHDDGRVETLGVGAEALEWRAAQLKTEIEALESGDSLAPNAEKVEAVAQKEQTLARVRGTLEEIYARGATEAAQQVPSSCDVFINQNASAGPSSIGPTASASASFRNTCGYIGFVDCLARARGTNSSGQTTEIIQTQPDAGTIASCTASAAVNATTACFSEAEACVDVNYPGEFVYFRCESDGNSQCRPPTPIGVEILGPTSVFVSAGTCQTVTWRASVTNGPASSFSWTLNGSSAGSSSQVSRTYCAPFSGNDQFLLVRLAVSVTGVNGADSDTHDASVTLQGGSICDFRDPCCQVVPQFGQGDGANLEEPCPILF